MKKSIMKKSLISGAAALALSGSLYAATHTVTTLSDEFDNNCTDTASLSLRDAVFCSANGESVDFNVTGSLSVTSTAVIIDKNISILGPGRENIDFVTTYNTLFSIPVGAEVIISGMTINGVNDYPAVSNQGTLTIDDCNVSGNYNYCTGDAAGVSNSGSLTITNSNISDNHIDYASGAAIRSNGGTAIIQNSSISGNSAGGNAGGAIANQSGSVMSIYDSNITGNYANMAGAVYNDASSLYISGSAFDSNYVTGVSSGGGAIYHSTGTLTIEKSSFEKNSAYDGGAVYADSTLEIKDSSFTENNASISGGGLYIWTGSANITNTTFSGNAAYDNGGGICVMSGDANISHSTLAYNSSGVSGAMTSGGGIFNSTGTVNIKNTIVANNVDFYDDGPDLYGLITSYGYNLIGTDEDANITLQTSDINGTDPLLDTLAFNGKTYFHPPTAPSIAIDSGICTDVAGSTLLFDQNGIARPQGSACDIGAVENIVINPTVTISPSSVSFGDIPIGGYAEQSITIENNSTVDLTVNGITLQTADTIAYLDDSNCSTGIILTPAGSCSVTVSVSPDAAGAYANSVVIDTDSSDGIQYVPVTANGTAYIESIDLSTNNSYLYVGEMTELSATANYNDSTTQDVTSLVSWSTTYGYGTIDSAGIFTALSEGQEAIYASYAGVDSTTPVYIDIINYYPEDYTDQTSCESAGYYWDGTYCTYFYEDIYIYSDNILFVGTTTQLSAWYSSSADYYDITDTASWTSSNPSVATVSTSGLLSGISKGSMTVTAAYNDLSYIQDFYVNDTQYTDLTNLNATYTGTPIENIGEIELYRVVLSESGNLIVETNSTYDPYLRIYDSSFNLVGEDDDGGEGLNSKLGRLLDAGEYYIGISGCCGQTLPSYDFKVEFLPGTEPILFTLNLYDDYFAVGESRQAYFSGWYTDGSIQDLSTQAVWSSDNPTVLSITSNGYVTTYSLGYANITAEYDGNVYNTTYYVEFDPSIYNDQTSCEEAGYYWDGTYCIYPPSGNIFTYDTLIGTTQYFVQEDGSFGAVVYATDYTNRTLYQETFDIASGTPVSQTYTINSMGQIEVSSGEVVTKIGTFTDYTEVYVSVGGVEHYQRLYSEPALAQSYYESLFGTIVLDSDQYGVHIDFGYPATESEYTDAVALDPSSLYGRSYYMLRLDWEGVEAERFDIQSNMWTISEFNPQTLLYEMTEQKAASVLSNIIDVDIVDIKYLGSVDASSYNSVEYYIFSAAGKAHEFIFKRKIAEYEFFNIEKDWSTDTSYTSFDQFISSQSGTKTFMHGDESYGFAFNTTNYKTDDKTGVINLVDTTNWTVVDSAAGTWKIEYVAEVGRDVLSVIPDSEYSHSYIDIWAVLSDGYLWRGEYMPVGEVLRFVLFDATAHNEFSEYVSLNYGFSVPASVTDLYDDSTLRIQIESGWNLLSLPAKAYLNQSDLNSVFGSKTGKIDYLAKYDPVGWSYFFVDEYDDSADRFVSLSSNEGFWLKVLEQFELVYPISEDTTASNEVRQLRSGWNLVGFNSDKTPQEVKSLYSGYTIESIWTYKNGIWSIYVPDAAKDALVSSAIPRISAISRFDGVWINIK